MEIQREWLERLIFGGEAARRFTQDSPVLPDVWIQYGITYARDPEGRVDLLLTPHRLATAPGLAAALRDRLAADRRARKDARAAATELAYNQSSVVAKLSFAELIRVLIPLSEWWHDLVWEKGSDRSKRLFAAGNLPALEEALARVSAEPGADAPRRARPPKRSAHAAPKARRGTAPPPGLVWMIRIVGTILLARDVTAPGDEKAAGGRPGDALLRLARDYREVVKAFSQLVRTSVPPKRGETPLFTASRNRDVEPTIDKSIQALKADAARRLFEIDCSALGWAILDSGVDAEHPAFRLRREDDGKRYAKPFEESPDKRAPERWKNRTRVRGTFDFTRIRSLLSIEAQDSRERLASSESAQAETQDLKRRLNKGRPVDWDKLRGQIDVPHDGRYRPPAHDHGTHVAGILGSDWSTEGWKGSGAPEEAPPKGKPLVGVCPDIGLWDFRVLRDDGSGDEFSVMAALQFIRHLNAQHEQPQIHGANLSLSIKHDVANYACGRTPVCDECERVVNSGVVVVAAAGNLGYMKFVTPAGDAEGYRSISITDPGNADAVITVGATHRYQPHTYGVSYFSSRGPTGDGRSKPDLVAPGEKITAPTPGKDANAKDGTSMAAPHVSGAAALLMARHRELLGEPVTVKQILCRTATDLGRERYFQGSGMVDVLRALQSV